MSKRKREIQKRKQQQEQELAQEQLQQTQEELQKVQEQLKQAREAVEDAALRDDEIYAVVEEPVVRKEPLETTEEPVYDDSDIVAPPPPPREEPATPAKAESTGWFAQNKENLLLGMLVLYVFLLGLGTMGELFEIEWILNLWLFR
jgi:multidrug efflux pump subunit AcrA (membrane-fusion protein)